MNPAVKVCHFTSVHPWNDIRIFEKECVGLAEAGFDVHLVSPNAVEGTHKGVHVHSVVPTSSGRIYRMLKLSKLVYEKALVIDADIYHFHDPELLPYGRKLQKKGKKVIYDSHEDVPADILHKYWIKPHFIRQLISKIYNLYEKNTVKKLSGLISVVEIITDKFINKNKATIKNFPAIKHFVTGGSERENTVIYSGGLMRIRGIKEIIQSLAYLTDKPKIILFGKWESEEYMQECMVLPEWKFIDFRGFVPVEETYREMAKAKIGLTLLQPVGQNLYSLPIKTFEYMASGLVSINSNFPYWKELFGDSALFVNPNDPEAIANKIEAVLSDDLFRMTLANKGKNLVNTSCNWESEKLKLIEFYQKIYNQP